ncbi:MAG: terpene cyclase/mutase family protein [Firmicutes bacterium]|nr:terpene cyclase/mutase family protein [Bacillota bacterium]
MDFEKGVEFVRRNGSEVEQARLQFLLKGERPSQDVVAKLFAGQRPDGGWPPSWASDYTSLDATCFRLAQAEQLGITASDATAAHAVRFLAQRQSADGSWEEDERVAAVAPSWAKPGDLSARLYLTANCGLWLALWGNAGNRASMAASYLQTHLDKDGRLPSFLHAHWLAGGLWHRLDWREPADRVFEYLSRRINDLAVSNLSWLITTLCAAGLTTDHHLVDKAAGQLEHGQESDGRWLSEDGPSHDVHSTLEALRALWLCGRVTRRHG